MIRTNIAMWSGPRNMSTTMMRSFSARADTVCMDEPFYAVWLAQNGANHPMREEILAAHETVPSKVIQSLIGDHKSRTGSPSRVPAICYQKHMTHHMIPEIDRAWMGNVQNVFLIRHPARVLASYARKMEEISLDAIGFNQQLDLFTYVRDQTGIVPVVIDSDDILCNPRSMLRALCTALGIVFDPSMLTWRKGPHPEDGVWAPHWYGAVWDSTGFGPAPAALPVHDGAMAQILAQALPIYEAFRDHRIVCD